MSVAPFVGRKDPLAPTTVRNGKAKGNRQGAFDSAKFDQGGD